MGKLGDIWKQVTGEQQAVPETAEAPPSDQGVPSRLPQMPPGAVAAGATNDDQRRRLESHGISHVGKVREGNEDHFVVASLQRSLEIRQTNLEDRGLLEPLCGPKAYLFAVADGVGGQAGGALASGITLQTIVQYLSETVGSYHAVPMGEEHAFLDPLRSAVQRAHDKVIATFGHAQGGPATTLTIMLVVWPRAYIVHVGDSRAYQLRDGKLVRLTRDQTMGAFLMAEMAMSEQQVEKGGYNNVLASAVGARDMTPAVSDVELHPGDVVMLCTDGLTKHVTEEQIGEVLSRSASSEAACRELVELALEGGGKDNVTVVVAQTLTQ